MTIVSRNMDVELLMYPDRKGQRARRTRQGATRVVAQYVNAFFSPPHAEVVLSWLLQRMVRKWGFGGHAVRIAKSNFLEQRNRDGS